MMTKTFNLNSNRIKAIPGVILFLVFGLCPSTSFASAGCSVLIYFNVSAGAPCDANSEAAVTNVIPVLTAAGANVTTIGVCSPTYDPHTDNWYTGGGTLNYSQVWDMRFEKTPNLTCSGSSPSPAYNDDFNANWQAVATTYLNDGGSIYINGENDDFFSRNTDNINFLVSIGATSNTFSGCTWNTATSNGYDSFYGTPQNTINGFPAAQEISWAVGGIPVGVLNGTDFLHDSTPSNWADGRDRSIAAGWSGVAQMVNLNAGSTGKLFMLWDTTCWESPYYPNAITDTFFKAVYSWLGGQASCGTPTNTPTNTPTPTVTQTPTNTATPTITATPTCVIFQDNYSSGGSLSNYNYYDKNWNSTTAAADYWSVSGGAFKNNPTGIVGTVGSYVLMTPAVFPSSLSTYTEEGDFNLGVGGQGLFGLIFLANAAIPGGYIFQWNGLNSRWEIEKQTGPGTYYYVGTNNAPAYALGNWVHLKIVVTAGVMNGYETPESSPGVPSGATVQIFNNVTDTGGVPYSSGTGGIRSYNVVNNNTLLVENFAAYNCPPATPTPTSTFTPIFSFTPTNTPTITPTPTPVTSITLSKGCNVSSAAPGTLLTYTLTLNVAGSSFNGVVITDVTPSNETFIGFVSAPPGTVETISGNTLTLTLPSPLAANATYQISYQEQVNSGFCGNLANTASLTYTGLITPITSTFNVNVPCPTSTFTPTATATPNLYIWPNPFNPSYGPGTLKAGYLGAGAVMSIYTISGELVISSNQNSPDLVFQNGYMIWNGRNTNSLFVSTGVYYYVIQNGTNTLLTGKLLVVTGK